MAAFTSHTKSDFRKCANIATKQYLLFSDADNRLIDLQTPGHYLNIGNPAHQCPL